MLFNAHYFLAVPIPLKIRNMIYQKINPEESGLQFQSWVHPEDYHITLFFLGAAEEHQLKGITDSIPDNLSKIQPFTLTLNRLDFFGMKNAPRVFWAGVGESHELNALQSKITSICSQFGFVPEERPYRPHITLARRWKGDAGCSLPSLGLEQDFVVDEVVLYRSHPQRTPKYEPVGRFPFQ